VVGIFINNLLFEFLTNLLCFRPILVGIYFRSISVGMLWTNFDNFIVVTSHSPYVPIQSTYKQISLVISDPDAWSAIFHMMSVNYPFKK